MQCSQALKANADFDRVTVMQGNPFEDLEQHARLADMKTASWLLWIDIKGEPLSQDMFSTLKKLI